MVLVSASPEVRSQTVIGEVAQLMPLTSSFPLGENSTCVGSASLSEVKAAHAPVPEVLLMPTRPPRFIRADVVYGTTRNCWTPHAANGLRSLVARSYRKLSSLDRK